MCGRGRHRARCVAGAQHAPCADQPQVRGDGVVPDPKRVVSVGIREADPMLALGVVPVAVTDFYSGFDEFTLPWPWAREQQGDAQIEVLSEFRSTSSGSLRCGRT